MRMNNIYKILHAFKRMVTPLLHTHTLYVYLLATMCVDDESNCSGYRWNRVFRMHAPYLFRVSIVLDLVMVGALSQ